MVTIYDIAKKVGCASSTVSRALNGTRPVNPELKNKIEKTAKEMGYVANITARNLISKESWTIGIIYHESLELGLEHQHFGAILQSFKTFVEKDGYDITFVSRKMGNQDQTYLQWCKSRRIVGVLIVTVDHQDDQLIEIINSDIPIVSVNKVDLSCSTIISDNVFGTNLAMEHFLKKGLKNIAHISMPKESFAGGERRDTYSNFIKENSLNSIDSLLIYANGYEFKDGYDATIKLIKSLNYLPEGFYIGSDMLAIGAISALKDLGYNVPNDTKVIGFDDIELSKYITPPLTTIRQDKKKIGEEAAKLLISYISGKENKRDKLIIKIPVNLIIRDSSL